MRKLIIMFSLMQFILIAEEDHQRLGVEKERKHLITPTVGLYFNSDRSTESYDLYLDGSLGLSYNYNRLFSLSLSQQVSSIVTTLDSRSRVALGDVGVTFSLYKRLGDYRLRGDLGYTYPLGIYDYYQSYEENINSGDGYHKPSIGLSISKIIDPTILNLSVDYTMLLFRKNRFKSTSKLGIVTLDLGVTEVLNDKLGYNISISNSLYLPETDFSSTKWRDISSGLSISFSLFYYIDKLSLNSGFSGQFDSGKFYPKTNLTSSYDIEF